MTLQNVVILVRSRCTQPRTDKSEPKANAMINGRRIKDFRRFFSAQGRGSRTDAGANPRVRIHADQAVNSPGIGQKVTYSVTSGIAGFLDLYCNAMTVRRESDVAVAQSVPNHKLLEGAELVLFPTRIVQVLVEENDGARDDAWG